MPVIELSLSRLKARTRNKIPEEKILDYLPFIGLDIEDRAGDIVTVEYSPNRPDFCSEAGIARSLLGLLGIETGLPKYDIAQSQIKISVEGHEIQSVRPFVFSLFASINLSDDVIKQLIVMQEDLHNGLGRHRSKVAIGIHNAEFVKPPIKYLATDDDSYSFVPLGSREKMSIREILTKTEQGVTYGKILSRGLFPLLIDSSGSTLSMPPIINGELTRLKQGIRSIFVDVTATERKSGETAIAIIASMLSDVGARVRSVEVQYDGSIDVTPNMMPETMRFDLKLTNEILGIKLEHAGARAALEKSRLELLSQNQARIPKFRSDIIHPIDLVEEVELGYGVQTLKPLRSKTYLSGSITSKTTRIRNLVDVLTGLGLIQIESLSLTSRNEAALDPNLELRVLDPKSQTYEFLRGQVLPSLLHVLGQSTHEEYPQRVFEQTTVFKKKQSADVQIVEEEHVAVAIAHSGSNYTSIRSVLDGFLRLALKSGYNASFEPLTEHSPIFAAGRTASVSLVKAKQKSAIGVIGEVSPQVLENLALKVPVAAFELSLEPFIND
jgi:phenylalanyl-tRNA synthetase beta chain